MNESPVEDAHSIDLTATGLLFEVAGESAPRALAWTALAAIRIVTSSGGPWTDDVHWEFQGPEFTARVGSEATGMDAAVPMLLKLPGMDHKAVIASMSCTDDRTFHVWTRD